MIRRLSLFFVVAVLSVAVMGCMSELAQNPATLSSPALETVSGLPVPDLSGEITGPDSASFGSQFDVMLIVTNNGRATAYDVTAALSPSGGLSVESNSLKLGTFRRGEKKSFTISVTAGGSTDPRTAGISATINYSNKSSGPRIWYNEFVSNHPVQLHKYEGAVVTIELRTALDPVHAGVVSVYDIYGHRLMTKTTETAAHVAFNLPPGTYAFSGGGRNKLEEIISGRKNVVEIGSRDSYVVVWLCTSLIWSECDLGNNPPVWSR